MKMKDWYVIVGVAAAVGAGLWWMERSAAGATGPVTTLVTGGRYQLTAPIPAGVTPDGSFTSSIINSYQGSGPNLPPQWQNVTVSISGNTYIVQGTYMGPGTPIPTGLTVTKIG
jgi:hypothetical protein